MASHTFPAAIVIADARLYAGQPVTEDLMMDLRDRDQDAADTGLEDRYIYNINGSYYAGAMTPIMAGTVALPGGAGSQPLLATADIVIPAGVSQVTISICAACTVSSNINYFRLYKDGVLTGDEWKNLPALGALDWRAEKIVAVTPGGAHNFSVEAKQDGGAGGSTFYLRGFRVRTL